MAIKKSILEKKMLYRAAKALLLILPILVIFLLSKGQINICTSSQKSILDMPQEYVVYIAIGVMSYYLILIAAWRLFLYIVFGGLEEDTKKQEKDQPPVQVGSKPSGTMQIIPIIIILSIVIIFILSEMGYIKLPKINLKSPEISKEKTAPVSTCYATSAQMSTPCGSVRNGVRTSGVIVPASCNCPGDTTYAQMDNITAGGPYKICTCN